jgi:hypothetical protein
MLEEICQHLPGGTQDDDLSGYPIRGLQFYMNLLDMIQKC